MTNNIEFANWMKENTKLSESSIYKYSHAVNTISKEMLENCIIPIDLFSMSIYQLDIYIPKVLNNSYFITKNSTGNKMYSNALKQYRMYCAFEQDMYVNNIQVEKVINDYETLNETEKKAIVKSRIGQGIFKEKLMKKYNSQCIITGICTKKLLIASHIKPWSVSNNQERLSGENGLLLSPTYDKLFDCGLISFYDNGSIIISSQINKRDLSILNISPNDTYNIKATSELKEYLGYHRDIIFVR